MRFPPTEGLFDELRTQIERLSEQLLARARDQGALRAELTYADPTDRRGGARATPSNNSRSGGETLPTCSRRPSRQHDPTVLQGFGWAVLGSNQRPQLVDSGRRSIRSLEFGQTASVKRNHP